MSLAFSRHYVVPEALVRLWNLRRRFPFARSVAVLSGGAFLGHCFTLAAAPLLTRLYVPSDIGCLALFNMFLGVSTVAASLQYEVAIVSAPTEKEAATLAVVSMMLAIPLSAAGGFLLFVLIHFSVAGFGILSPYAAGLMIPAIACVGLFEILRYWSLRGEKFGIVSQAMVFQNGARSISQLGFGVLGAHSAGLLAGEVLGRCIGMGQMLRSTWATVRTHSFRFGDAAKVLRTNRRFPLYFFPSSLLNQFGTSLPLPVLVILYGADTGGYYALVWRLLAIPLVLVGASMADAFHSRAALLAREDANRVVSLFHRTTAALLAIGIIPALILSIYGEPLFEFIFGSKWRLSGTIASLVAPWFLTSFVVSPVTRLVYVLQGQRLKLIYDSLILTGNLSVFALARTASWPMLRTVATLSGINTGSIVLYYLVLLRIATTSHRRSRGLAVAK